MKSYNSIPRASINGDGNEYFTFDKIDGRLIRAAFSHKTGFYTFGSKNNLINKDTPILGEAINIFMGSLSEPLSKIATDNKWINIIVFAEFWGENSFAGEHVQNDVKFTTLLDVAIYKKGIMGPKEFLQHFQYCQIPNFLGVRTWDANFITEIRNDVIEGVSFEGVIGKSGSSHNLKMMKTKTNKWLNKVKDKYPIHIANSLINS